MSCAKSEVVLISSSRTQLLAEKLADELRDHDFCTPTLWTEEERQKNMGATIIEMLEDVSNKKDFAVIILSRDDVNSNNQAEELKARDNCVLEAGYFMAALGRRRCFLLNSVDQKELPSDLAGVISIPFTEPDDLSNRSKCEDAIKRACSIIKDKIDEQGRVVDRSLSSDEILARESLKPAGELDEDQVVVASVQPRELDHKPALQVRHNITAGIRYVYFFYGDTDGAQKTCRLLQKVLLAPMLESEPENADKFSVREGKIRDKDNQQRILDDLKRICDQGSLTIFFLPRTPKLQYVIHNATSAYEAVLYLRHDNDFIQWETGQKARDFWAEIREIYRIDIDFCSSVFQGLAGFEVIAPPFYKTLENEMRRYFPEIHQQVLSLCCEGTRSDSTN